MSDATKIDQSECEYRAALARAFAVRGKPPKVSLKRTELAPDAPAPKLGSFIEQHGPEPTKLALYAWEARVTGTPIIDVAHQLGLSIHAAKLLIGEVHQAIHEDLKANLDLNRQLDLARIDGLLQVYYPLAKAGDPDMAGVTIKCIQQRGKLIGLEAMPDPGRSNPQSVLVWIQNQLPTIHKLVDQLPIELPNEN
jgi:hypothetical protein